MNGRIATLMVHTSPLDQPGIGDAGGMNIYVTESAERMAAMGVQVDIFTRRTNKDVADIVEISPGVRVRHLNVGPVDGVTKERLPELIGELSKEFTRMITCRSLRCDSFTLLDLWKSSDASGRKARYSINSYNAHNGSRKEFKPCRR
jgi:hypothetical protein